MENRYAFDITDEQKKKVQAAIQTLVEVLQPILIALDKRDKQTLAKMSDKSIPFVEKTMQYMQTNPQFTPAFVNAPEAQKDFDAFKDLREFLRPLMQMSDNLDDTATLAGSEAWLAALAYYNSVKAAAKMGVPDAKAILADLQPRFEAQRAKPARTPKP